MKKLPVLLFVLALGAAASAQQGPVYINDAGVSPYIVEFAANGQRRDMAQEMNSFVHPFVQNGRVYFIGVALPMSQGNLRAGFEFNLELDNGGFAARPRVKGLYRGAQNFACNASEIVLVAGYAERGSITITNVFLDEDSLEAFSKTVRLAF